MSRDIIDTLEVVGGGQRGMGEAASDELVEGELGLELDGVADPAHVLGLDALGHLQARLVGDVQTASLGLVGDDLLGSLGDLEGRLEGESLVLGLDLGDGAAVDQQRREDGELDLLDILGARARNNKALKSRPSKSSRNRGQERRLGGDLVEVETVETILLTLLTDDGRDETDHLGKTLLAEDDVGVLQDAEDDGGESLGEGDGVLEVGGGELVLAGRGRKLVG